MIGYHGTCQCNIEDIINNGFKYKPREDHWLGQGIYFYDDFDLAKWWIETKIKNDKRYSSEHPAVIKCTYNENIKILNLDKNEGVDRARREIAKILDDLLCKGISITINKQDDNNKYRCFLLDILKQEKNYGGIIKTFIKNNPSYRTFKNSQYSSILEQLDLNYSETQICITDNSYIKKKECL